MNCLEDATQHGRLLALKKILAEHMEEKQLDDQQLALMYAKDIALATGADIHEEESAAETV